LLSNRTRHVFDAEALLSTKPAEATAIGDELGPYARMQAILLTNGANTCAGTDDRIALADEDRVDHLFIGRLPDRCDGGVCNAHYWGRHSLADQSSFCEGIRQAILALRVRVGKLTVLQCSRIAITCSGHGSMNVTSNPVRAKSAPMDAPAPNSNERAL
jgi:hypothetical protein